MLDIQFIRDNPDKVARAMEHKRVFLHIDEILLADQKRLELQQELDGLKMEKNRLNEQILGVSPEVRIELIEEGKKIKEKIELLSPLFYEAEKKCQEIMVQIPNIPSEDTPIGKDESENIVLRRVGEKPTFSFPAREHWEIGDSLRLIDSERAVKVSGSRFNYLRGDLVMMEFALMYFGLSVLTNEDILASIASDAGLDIPKGAFIPVLPPVMMRPDMMIRMARLNPEEMYQMKEDNLVLIGSAEHTLGPMYADEILEEKDLPIRLVGFSTAFRREAGTYGRDTKGMLRVHQFNKLEMETFSTRETALAEQNFNVAIQEYFMKQLGIPYQVVSVCTGDMGKPDVRQIDIEAWMPGQNKYRETHTADLIGDFQARRLNTRVRRHSGSLELVHMNDATAFSERPLIAILENYQQEDGGVVVPEILRKWVGKERITGKSLS